MELVIAHRTAGTDLERALAAIQVSRNKDGRKGAWKWARIAISDAEAAGIKDADYFISGDLDGYPDCSELEDQLRLLCQVKS